MIYLFDEYSQLDKATIDILIGKLPPLRATKARNFRSQEVQLSCVLGYLMFLYGFRHIFNEKGSPEWSISESGKPYLANYSNIYFNISHCLGAAACILDTMPVGIDIQDIRTYRANTMLKVCSEDEAREITSSTNPGLEFCRIWSAKECLAKLSGEGIFRDVKELDSSHNSLRTTFITPNKYLTATSLNPNADYTIYRPTLDELLLL